MIDDYNKVIESLTIKFIRSNALQVIRPVRVKNFYDVQNSLILVNSGVLTLGEGDRAEAGDLIFIPGGKVADISFGSSESEEVANETFINRREQYLKQSKQEDAQRAFITTNFTTVTFDAKAFDSVNFFTSLDLPPFVLKDNVLLRNIVERIFQETSASLPGKSRVTDLLTQDLSIELFRHILRNRMFVEQLATNSNYFKDSRLIDIFNYIKDNLAGDLSNKVLASVANVSEDYVGQYFKMLTGINPQDYIEYQRMEKAVELLRTSKKSIRAIGTEVGYKDTAYFCRRFKMMFGIPAGKMRRRDSLIDI